MKTNLKIKKIFLLIFVVGLTASSSRIEAIRIRREQTPSKADAAMRHTAASLKQSVAKKSEPTGAITPSYRVPEDNAISFDSRLWSPFLNKYTAELEAANIKDNELRSARVDMVYETLDTFITKHFNDVRYADYLSQNASDVILLLEKIKSLDLGNESLPLAYTVLKIFNDKFKQCELVDDTTFTQLLTKLPEHLTYLFEKKEKPTWKIDLEKMANDSIVKSFSSHLPLAQSDPDQFCSLLTKDLSGTLSSKIHELLEEHEEKVRMQDLIIRLLENIASKVMWSPTDYESFLPSLNKINQQLLSLTKKSIISYADDYDSILWSINHRACFFLDLCGSHLPLHFYSAIEEELDDGVILLLEGDEQDGFIRSKKEVFTRAVQTAYTQAYAYRQHGILS